MGETKATRKITTRKITVHVREEQDGWGKVVGYTLAIPFPGGDDPWDVAAVKAAALDSGVAIGNGEFLYSVEPGLNEALPAVLVRSERWLVKWLAQFGLEPSFE